MPLNTSQVLQHRYRVISLLGRGGMGAVYRAWDTRLGVPVALKEMIPQPGLDPHTLAQLRQQFQQEASVLARLHHPHLVRVSDFFEEDGNAYLVMDFVEGESLARRIEREGPLPESQVLKWADELLDALAYCHAQGVFHRDVKPQNVIVRPDGQAMLVDFGLMKLWDPSDPHTRTVMRGMGTPEYAPPEQYDTGAGHTDARSDIYSLGATLYHALTGRAPPTATQRIVNPGVFLPIRQLRPQVSSRLEAVLMKALTLRPEGRFRSATEMRAVLRGAPPASVPAQPPTRSARAISRRRGFPWTYVILAIAIAVAGVAILGGLALGAAWFSRKQAAGVPVSTTPAVTFAGGSGSEGGATATVVPTPPRPTATSVYTPTPTPTSSPTTQPQPTDTPSPTDTPTPTETPTPACPEVTGPFADIWQETRDRLGCATNEAHTTWLAEESFDHGRMFWRKDTDRISVQYESGAWASYANAWAEGDPEFSCPAIAPEESPPTPKRGFGKVWCANEGVRNGLGWATDPEYGYYGTVQDFEHGSIIRTEGGATYVRYADGEWEQR